MRTVDLKAIRTMTVSAKALAGGYMTIGRYDWARYAWDVVELHDDGAATVKNPGLCIHLDLHEEAVPVVYELIERKAAEGSPMHARPSMGLFQQIKPTFNATT